MCENMDKIDSLIYIGRVHDYINGKGLRLSVDAEELLKTFLNRKVKEAIQLILDNGLPKIKKGKNLGEFKKTTITSEILKYMIDNFSSEI